MFMTLDSRNPDHLYLDNGFLVNNFDVVGTLKCNIEVTVPKSLIAKLNSILALRGWSYSKDDSEWNTTHQRVCFSVSTKSIDDKYRMID